MRHRPRLSAPRERNAWPPLRLDNPGPGAQPQGVRGSDRHHEEVLDRTLVFASRRELLGAAHVHQVEPQADHRLLPARQGGTPVGRGDAARRSRHVLRRQPGAGDHDHAQGAAGLPPAGTEAAPAALGAADQRPLAQVRRRARDQRGDDCRAERPAATSRSITRRRRRRTSPTCTTAAGSGGIPRSGAAS